jgi:hypothetical protein
MIKYEWKVLDIDAKNGIILSAKYFCKATENELSVETEGNCFFRQASDHSIPFEEVTEQTVLNWINTESFRDGKNLITSRLDEQIDQLKNQKTVVPPWLPQIFKVQI